MRLVDVIMCFERDDRRMVVRVPEEDLNRFLERDFPLGHHLRQIVTGTIAPETITSITFEVCVETEDGRRRTLVRFHRQEKIRAILDDPQPIGPFFEEIARSSRGTT